MTRELSTSGDHVTAWIGSWCRKISAAFQKPQITGASVILRLEEPVNFFKTKRSGMKKTLFRPVSQPSSWAPEAVCVTARTSQNVGFWCSTPNNQTWKVEWPEKAVIHWKVQDCPEAFLKATAEHNGQIISVRWHEILTVWLQPPVLCVEKLRCWAWPL